MAMDGEIEVGVVFVGQRRSGGGVGFVRRWSVVALVVVADEGGGGVELLSSLYRWHAKLESWRRHWEATTGGK